MQSRAFVLRLRQLVPSDRRLAAAVLLGTLLVYAVFLVRHTGGVAGGSDSSGYLNQARILAGGTLQTAVRTIEGVPPTPEAGFLYVPLGFSPVPDAPAWMRPTYPAGLSLLVCAAAPLVGWDHAPVVVLILHTLAGLLLTYALARHLELSPGWALAAVLLLAASPLYVFMGTQPMSDVPALVWITGAVLAAERSRTKTAWASLAGFAFAGAVLLRPTNLILILPVALALGGDLRRWVRFAVGGLPGALFHFRYAEVAYGSWLATGYGDVSELFRAELLGPTLRHYVQWLPQLFSPLVLLVIGLPWLLRQHFRRALLLLLWFGSVAGLYAVYEFTHHTWWFLRFLLPSAPALLIGALCVARAAASGLPSSLAHGWLGAALLGAAVVLLVSTNRRLHAHLSAEQEQMYADAARWAQSTLPADAVVLAMQTSGALLYYTDLTFVRWDMASPELAARIVKTCHQRGQPLYALLFPFEQEAALERFGGTGWQRWAEFDQVTAWRWMPEGASEPPAPTAER